MIYSVKVEKFHNDENRHTTYTIYKTAKLEWSNIVENFELNCRSNKRLIYA